MVSEFLLEEASSIPSKGEVTNPLLSVTPKSLQQYRNQDEVKRCCWNDKTPVDWNKSLLMLYKENTENQRKPCQCQLMGKLVEADTLGRCFDFSQNLVFLFSVTCYTEQRQKKGWSTFTGKMLNKPAILCWIWPQKCEYTLEGHSKTIQGAKLVPIQGVWSESGLPFVTLYQPAWKSVEISVIPIVRLRK